MTPSNSGVNKFYLEKTGMTPPHRGNKDNFI